MTPRTTRAGRLAHPTTRDAVRAVAEAHGACLHPVQLRRINTDTGQIDQVLIPCGATLASKCPPCAERAKVLRAAQCAEGWHLDTEPIPDSPPPDEVQAMWVEHRAQAQAMRDHAEQAGQDTGELDELITELDQEIASSGLRGKADPARSRPRCHRSTRRRQDAPDLPKRRISARTIGKTYTTSGGKTFRPSMFLTLTCPSYGRVGEDGTPADPGSYDYQHAARDALHFAALFDRFTQNLRRVMGYDVQYFATIEPQRRLAPHVPDRRTPDRVRQGRSACPDQRTRSGRLHRGGPRPAHDTSRCLASNPAGGVMANRLGHRRFGNVRRLPSGRYQIRYPGPDGRMRAGAETYERLTSARRALALIEAQLVTGEWTDPIGRKIRLRSYAERWIAHHAGLRPRTRELYAWLLSAHIIPYLGAMPLGSITPDTVREWRATLLSAGVSQTATAKAYRLLRAVLMTAAEDRIIPRNPCRIRGGGDEKPPERPVLTIAQVLDLADRMAARRFRVLILLATFASLRWGEAIALRRCDLDLTACTVSIRRQYVETNGSLLIAPPKSRAGIRTVAFPATLVPELREHLDAYAGPDSTALMFTGPRGGMLRRGNHRKASGWSDAVAAIGLPGLHFHDLRHTGNTLAAQAGVSLADLKARMGHDSVRAAMIYQHAAAEADQKIASTLDQRMGGARDDARDQS